MTVIAAGRGGIVRQKSVVASGFPVVQGAVLSKQHGPGSTHSVDMPATVNAGEKLFIFGSLKVPGGGETVTPPAGWTLNYAQAGLLQVYGFVLSKTANGTEGGTSPAYTLTTGRNGVTQVYRVSGWGSITYGTPVTGTDAQGDPPAVTAGAAGKNLFIEVAHLADDDVAITAPSTNYGDLVSSISGDGANASASVGTARRELQASSDNPGVMSFASSEDFVCNTLVIEP